MDGMYYAGMPRFHVAVDCMIFSVIDGKLHILLVERDFEPEKGKLSLVGGFVMEKENVDEAAKRVLDELTGIRDAFILQIGAFGEVDRDPGARVISVAYLVLLKQEDLEINKNSGKVKWMELDMVPQLSFDHPEMIKKALSIMREKILNEALAFYLLPELFTLTQLQHLVESVTGRKLDKRNFRKRVLDLPGIYSTDLVDKQTSKRGAKLYRYNLETNKNIS